MVNTTRDEIPHCSIFRFFPSVASARLREGVGLFGVYGRKFSTTYFFLTLSKIWHDSIWQLYGKPTNVAGLTNELCSRRFRNRNIDQGRSTAHSVIQRCNVPYHCVLDIRPKTCASVFENHVCYFMGRMCDHLISICVPFCYGVKTRGIFM